MRLTSSSLTTVNSLTTSNIIGGHDYYFRAHAVNIAGNGPYSDLAADPIPIKEQSIQKAPVLTSHLEEVTTAMLKEELALIVDYSSATPGEVKWYRKLYFILFFWKLKQIKI